MRVAVCDDQPLICREVEQHLRDFEVHYHCNMEISVYQTGKALLSADILFHIIFLDIELDKENGIEVAEQYRKNNDSLIIFLTSHVEEMPNGYKVRAFRFLVKPINIKLFHEALNAAIDEINSERKLQVQSDEKTIIISTKNIIYVEAGDRCSCVRTEDGFYRNPMILSEMYDYLGGREFYMPHRSYIVNMDYIREIEKKQIVMRNGERIEISKLKWKQFNDYFHRYLRGKMNGCE